MGLAEHLRYRSQSGRRWAQGGAFVREQQGGAFVRSNRPGVRTQQSAESAAPDDAGVLL
jgi:hypothetical protein